MIGAHRNRAGEMSVRRDEHPTKRVNPGGDEVWVARYTTKENRRRSAGTFEKRGPCKRPQNDGACCAQHRIYWAYEQDKAEPATVGTIREYATKHWLRKHPRSERTDAEHVVRLRAVLDVDLGAGPLGDMLFADVDRSHAVELRHALLVDQGRAANGARGIIGTVTAMWRDALDDGWTKTACPFRDLPIRRSDTRIQKPAREPNVWTWEQMHAIAAHAGRWEAMLRVMSDCGPRIGEVLPLHREDFKLGAGACDEAPKCLATGPHVHFRRKAWKSVEYPGTKTGERIAPLAPGLVAKLRLSMPIGDGPANLVFPSSTGRIWWETEWRRQVWTPATIRAGLETARPHDFRHSWVSLMRAALVDINDLAVAAGHSPETASRTYSHGLGRSFDAMRLAVGE